MRHMRRYYLRGNQASLQRGIYSGKRIRVAIVISSVLFLLKSDGYQITALPFYSRGDGRLASWSFTYFIKKQMFFDFFRIFF